MRMTGILSAGQGWGVYYPYTVRVITDTLCGYPRYRIRQQAYSKDHRSERSPHRSSVSIMLDWYVYELYRLVGVRGAAGDPLGTAPEILFCRSVRAKVLQSGKRNVLGGTAPLQNAQSGKRGVSKVKHA